MALPVSIDDPRRTPIIIAVALGIHVVAALAMPSNIRRMVEAIASPDVLVEFETMTPLPEPELVEPEPPEPVDSVEREQPADDARESVATHDDPAPVPAETPVAETAAPASTEVLVGAGTSAMGVPEGQVTGSQLRLGPASNGTDTTAAPAVVVDTRAMARAYRGSIRSAIGNVPRLRGVNEPIDANVLIGLRIGADGRVTDVRIVRSSGHDVIDQHVLDFYRSVHQVPAPPPELQLERQELTIRVETGV